MCSMMVFGVSALAWCVRYARWKISWLWAHEKEMVSLCYDAHRKNVCRWAWFTQRSTINRISTPQVILISISVMVPTRDANNWLTDTHTASTPMTKCWQKKSNNIKRARGNRVRANISIAYTLFTLDSCTVSDNFWCKRCLPNGWNIARCMYMCALWCKRVQFHLYFKI